MIASTHHRYQRRGISIVAVIVAAPLMVGMAALVVDVGFMNSVQMDLRRTADAASLAGVGQLARSLEEEAESDDDDDEQENHVVSEAQWFADLNMPSQGIVLADTDIIRGNWNPDTRSFTPLGAPQNAVQVTARRAHANANPISMYFAKFLGINKSDLSASAVAFAPPPQSADVVPVALPVPGFGPVDPDIVENNPGKSGPSEPLDGNKFQIGEEVALFIFGKGKQSPVHLVLDIPDSQGVSDIDKILSGEQDPVPISIGDQMPVVGEGSGNGGFGGKLEDRMTDGNPDNDTVILPIIDTLPDSRNGDGELSGDIEVVDFVAVTLTEIREFDVTVPNPGGGSDTTTIRVLFGDITRRAAGSGDGTGTTGGEFSAGSVLSIPLLVQ